MVGEIHLLWVILWSDLQSLAYAEHLTVGKDIPLGKYLLGAAYHLMYQVAAQLLKNEPVHTISGPWWLIQLWLNLYMYKIVRPDLRS